MYKLEIRDDMCELEKFVRTEAENYVSTTCFLSVISERHPNIDSVVEKGKEITPYLINLFEEQGSYKSHQNMYMHYFLLVMQRLYGNPFDGYVGMDFAAKYWLKLYKHGLLEEKDFKKASDKEKRAFLCDLLDCSEDELKTKLGPA